MMSQSEQGASMAAAEAFFGAGRLSEAEAQYAVVGRGGPEAARARYRLGQINLRTGRVSAAVEWLRSALELQPRWADAQHELAVAWLADGKVAEALGSLQSALDADERHTAARRTLADLYQTAGRYREAGLLYAALLSDGQGEGPVQQSYGYCCQELGEYAKAEGAYRRALTAGLDSPELRFNLGVTQLKQGRLREAIISLMEALRQEPGLTLANLALANIYRQMGDLDGAEQSLRRELEINPNCADAAVNLGVVLQEKHRVGEAIACYRQAIELNPHHPVLHWNFAIASLLAGNYETGWNEYEWRWQVKRKAKPKFVQPEWDGKALDGRRILLYAEQGFGDTLMFVRYGLMVAGAGGQVMVECQPPLKRLLGAMPELERVVGQGEPLPGFEVQAPLMSLPRILGRRVETEYRWQPYLRAPEAVRVGLPVYPRALRVGVVWASNPQHPVFADKSLPLARWEPIIGVEGVEFFSLQVDADPEALDYMRGRPRLHRLAEPLRDFAETAAVIAQLDLVISVDTAVAHLAGGMGQAVWVLLSHGADWRWLLKRSDSPWYPTMRLFRQPARGDWDSVTGEVARHLKALVEASRVG